MKRSIGTVFASLFVSWAALGFLHGSHWWILRCFSQDAHQRKLAVAHNGSYWLALLLVCIGGTWCRNYTSVECAGGEVMSRSCLWDKYPAGYQIIYVAHYIGLGWLFAHWILDAFQLWSWASQLTEFKTLRLFSSIGFHGFAYATIIAVTTLIATITWCVVINWSTADGLGVLTLILLAEIFFVGLLTAVMLRLSVAQGWLKAGDMEKETPASAK